MIQNKRRKYYKFLSIIISFVMIFTALPLIPVFADIEEGIASIIPDPLDGNSGENAEPSALDPSLPKPVDIEDGVYAIKNVGNSTSSYSLYMDTQYAHWLPGYHMQQYKFTGTATPCSNFSVSALFKITNVNGAYSIRILRNSLLSFALSEKADGSNEFLTVEIPLDDEDVPSANLFSILKTNLYANDYVISQRGTSKYIAANDTDASGSAGAPNSYLYGTSTISEQSRWQLVRYTGEEKESASLLGSGSLMVGEETELYPVFYSTRPGYNQLSLDIQSPSSESCLIDDSSPYGKIRITPYTDEDIVVDIKAGNGTDSYTIDTQTWSVGVPFEEGIYFFKNVRDTNKYVQINNIDNMDQDTIIELHNLNGYYYQRWNVEHVWNQYYKIISTHSDKALTAPTGANNDVVTQTDYTGELTQRWKFIEQSDGTYKISPESNSNYFMAAGDISSTADQDLEIRTAQSDDGDKWEPIRMLPTSGYELPYSPELWDYSPVRENTNCYAYAIDNQVNLQGEFYNQNPGAYVGSDIGDQHNDVSQYSNYIVNLVSYDVSKYNADNGTNLIFEPIGRYEVCPAGTYKVALVTFFGENERDYHWYRQDSDGLWSNKFEGYNILRYDQSQEPIIDPMICNRGPYTTFVGYFAISPWGNYYDGSVNSTSRSPGSVTKEAEYISLKSLNQICKGMTYDEVTEILGTTGEMAESGYTIYRYVLTDGRIVNIKYRTNDIYDLNGVVDCVLIEGEPVIS